MRKAGDIITALFRERFGPEFMETARSSATLFSSWQEIVTEIWPRAYGAEEEDVPAAAVHSQIRELERGVLLIEADHPGWIQILQTKQGELLSAVQHRYPKLDIRGIAFRLNRQPFAYPEPAPVAVNSMPQAEYENRSNEIKEPPPEFPVEAPRTGDAPRDEDFYTALKSLEESIKIRNSL